MSEFDIKAAEWDLNPMHLQRSVAIADTLKSKVKLTKNMKLMEFGAGTGNTGFLLLDDVKEVVLIDSSREMVRVASEKITTRKAENIKAVLADLETSDSIPEKFDIIVTQMVLHHIIDVDGILKKFSKMLNSGGILAIADLHPEDGSFHGEGFGGHNGFEIEKLSALLRNSGFTVKDITTCFTIERNTSSGVRLFDVFLMIAYKG